MARFPKTLRSTQRAKHSKADGHMEGSPTPFNRDTPRPVEIRRLSNITIERKRLNPSPMAKHFTNFAPVIRGQVRIPKDIVSSNRDGQDGRLIVSAGDYPED